jgi:hypothetical protein
MRLKPRRRRVMAKLRGDRSNATGPNQVWAMDWMHDELFDGRRLWVLTFVDTGIRVGRVMRERLCDLALEAGSKPIITDPGPLRPHASPPVLPDS